MYPNHGMNTSQHNKYDQRAQSMYQQYPVQQNYLAGVQPQVYFLHTNNYGVNQNIDGFQITPGLQMKLADSTNTVYRQNDKNSLQAIFQDLTGDKPEECKDKVCSTNNKSNSTELKNRFKEAVDQVPESKITEIKKSFIDIISAAAHANGELDSNGATKIFVQQVEKTSLQKVENGIPGINEDVTQVSNESDSRQDISISKNDVAKHEVSHIENDLKESQMVVAGEKPQIQSPPATNVGVLRKGPRISYSLGDLLEYSDCAESMTLKSLNAISKYVIRCSNGGHRSRIVPYHRSENSFVSHKERIKNLSESQAAIERLKISIRTCLNKLTAQNISWVHVELTKLKFDHPDHSDCLAESFVSSVSKNSLLISNYAHLTTKLIESIRSNDQEAAKILKNKISARCLKNLEISKEWLEAYNILKSRKISTLSEHDILNEELLETEETQRKVHLGTITYLSHLLKLRVFDDSNLAIKVLTILTSDTHEYVIEMLCKYLTLYGSELEKLHKKEVSDVFDKIKGIISDCPRRLQFLLEDVISLRDGHWKENSSEFQTKKFIPLKTFKTSQYAPQRSNQSNKISVSTMGVHTPSFKRIENRRSGGSYGFSGSSHASVQHNKFGSLANDVSDPSELVSLQQKRQQSTSQRSGINRDRQTVQKTTSVSVKSHSTSDEPLSTSAPISVSDVSHPLPQVENNADELKNTLEELVLEYAVSLDTSVILGRIVSYDIQYLKTFVEVALVHFVEKKTSEHRFLGDLFVVLFKDKRIDKSTLVAGFKNYYAYVEINDLQVDIPNLWNFTSHAIVPLILSGDLTICEYIELIVNSGHQTPEDVLSELLDAIVKTTSKRTLYLLCETKEFFAFYDKFETLKQKFSYLRKELELLDSDVALQNVFVSSQESGNDFQPYSFEEGKVDMNSLTDFSRIIYSRCPSGPYEKIKKYVDELAPILKKANVESFDKSHILHFFTVICACLDEQNKLPKSFLGELTRGMFESKLIEDSLKDVILSISRS